MRVSASFLICLLGMSGVARGEPDEETVKVSLPTSEWIQRADLHFLRTTTEPVAWLLLCPGKNGNGEGWIKDPRWKTFATEHKLLMCGLSFASTRKDDELGRYTQVEQGSGDMVLQSCKDFAGRDLPLVVFGFSAGARFTANFQAWKPDRVVAWCAQAVGTWPEQTAPTPVPPGIVASGEYDAGSWFPSLQYFQAGRKGGKHLVWLSLEKIAHQRSPALEDFARDFFAFHLAAKQDHQEGEWRDIDSKNSLNADAVAGDPIFATWLPSKNLAVKWEIVHHP